MAIALETLEFQDADAFRAVCGPDDQHLRIIEELLSVEIDCRGNTVNVRGESSHDVAVAADAVDQFYALVRQGYKLYASDVPRGVRILAQSEGTRLSEVFLDTVFVASGKRRIAAKNLSQKRYIDALRGNDLTFGIGAAGTGKTYLAMAMAVNALLAHQVKRIILTRPAVEAGEKLGFLPGDMAEKVNPYLRPLYDALYDMLDMARVQKLILDNTIEVAPLAFMRGRTLSNAIVILDESQNTTAMQMKMFLTRLGENSRMIVTGDPSQVDLPPGQKSGLRDALSLLTGVEGVARVDFTEVDVVRHELVARIVRAYDEAGREATLAAEAAAAEAAAKRPSGRGS